ncbi:hypothetical protein PM082_016846 [Marasmius tenuissimus]|nr:hypothetical protein PM082_016846 [Marasmius tenuissimus]
MFATSKGHNLHLRQAASCKGWMSFSKSRAIEEPIDEESTLDNSAPLHNGYAVDEFEVENNLFHWIKNTMDIDIGEAGPGPSTTERSSGLKRMAAGIPFSLTIKETEVFSEPHKNRGKVIRMAELLYEKWRARFEDKDESKDEDKDDEHAVYSPFTSKQDWQIAQWAVQENVGQGAFDQLLKIPGVIERLKLFFKTSRHLNKIVDSIPARGSQWKTKDFRFNNTPPNEIFSVRYRDPLKAIKALWEVSASGVEMVGGDSAVRKVHPIVSCYVADYPEQCLVGCSKYGTCLKCQCSKEQLSEMAVKPKHTQTWTTSIIDTAKTTTPNVPQYVKSCMSQGVSGYVYRPFWMDFWGTDVYMSLTPDVLHQLYQGMFKHLVKWCQEILSEEELDQRV